MKIDRSNVFWLAVAMIIPLLAAGFSLPRDACAEKAGSFAGSWIASGQRQAFDFLEGREVGTFRLTGHVNLSDNLAAMEDYWAECVGLADSATGGSARCVWHSMAGDRAYIVLSGQPLKQGVKVSGEFVGGSATLQGIQGSFTFTWSSVFINKNQGVFTGQTKDLKGSYKIP